MKDLSKITFCLGLQVEHFVEVFFYIRVCILESYSKQFSMDVAQTLRSPMVAWSLNLKYVKFTPCDEGEICLRNETPYLAAIGALMYLANCTTSDILFGINLLARFYASQQNGIEMVSNKSYDTSRALWIKDCFIKLEMIATSKDTWMQVSFLIHIKNNHKHVIFFLDKRATIS